MAGDGDVKKLIAEMKKNPKMEKVVKFKTGWKEAAKRQILERRGKNRYTQAKEEDKGEGRRKMKLDVSCTQQPSLGAQPTLLRSYKLGTPVHTAATLLTCHNNIHTKQKPHIQATTDTSTDTTTSSLSIKKTPLELPLF